MIAVSSMTLADVVAQMDIRSGQALTAHNSDWGSLVRYVRDARRDMFVRTHPYTEWAYHQTMQVTDQTVIPADFIRPTRLVVWPTGGVVTSNYEARRVDPREWFSVTNPGRAMSFTKASLVQPVYMIWSNQVDSSLWASTQMLLWLYPATGTGQLDYVASYADADLIESVDTVKVPVVLESLLIDMALLRLLDDVADTNRLATVRDRVLTGLARYSTASAAALIGEALNQEAVPAPEPTQTISVEGGR